MSDSDKGELVAVTELVEGDVIDLTGDPYADPNHGPGEHMDECTWQYETAIVGGEDGPGELESPTYYRLDFVHMGGLSAQGFPPEHKVRRVGRGAQLPTVGGIRDGQWRVTGMERSPDPARRITKAQAREWLDGQPARVVNKEGVQRYVDDMAAQPVDGDVKPYLGDSPQHRVAPIDPAQ